MFNALYEMQKRFQQKVIKKIGYNGNKDIEICDNVDLSSYHSLAMMEEVGELIKSDKRWKNYRNEHYDKENKKEELADCFITLFNIAMFSGINGDELESAIMAKIISNHQRIDDNDYNY